MLVLSRHEGERILIGEEIEIEVLRIGSQVRLGITAPNDVSIVRAELVEPEEDECPAH